MLIAFHQEIIHVTIIFFLVISAGIVLKFKTSWSQLFQDLIHVHPCHPLQWTTESSFIA